ncbi:hypothetical protein TNCV_3825741, partial [Trichonephila clavipes]
ELDDCNSGVPRSAGAVSSVPASDEVCCPFFELVAMRCVPSCEKCWIQVSPVSASDEVCPPVFCKCARILSVPVCL